LVPLDSYNPAIPWSIHRRAVERARGQWVVYLQPADELSPSALVEILNAAQTNTDALLIYSDEDCVLPDGRRGNAIYKPDWSPELLLTQHYVGRLTAYRRDALAKLDLRTVAADPAVEYDYCLRLAEQPGRIVHVPQVLYHRSVEHESAAAPWMLPAGSGDERSAIESAIQRRGLSGSVRPARVPGVYEVNLAPKSAGLVSIIIPTRDRAELLKQCVDSIFARTDYPHWEIVIVNNESQQPETLELFREWSSCSRIRVLDVPGPFNFSRLNNLAAAQATAPMLLLLNNDTEVIRRTWLDAMVGYLQLDGVGAAGAKLYFPNETIQHAGLFLGAGPGNLKPARSPHKRFQRHDFGYRGSLQTANNVSAVTGACLLTHRSTYQAVGGLDEQLAVAYNDVDFCLKVRKLGQRIVWVPQAELFHYESASRGIDAPNDPRWEREKRYMREKWGVLADDPYYNPHLRPDVTNFAGYER
jgi:GT2 family glycosyltransferase